MLSLVSDLFPTGQTLTNAVWQERHRGIVTVLWAHALGLPVFGWMLGWPGLLNLAAGMGIAVISVLAGMSRLNRRLRTGLATSGLILASALVVHLSHGYIEAHFHFFVMLAVIALYQDWVPFVLALALIVLHHGVMGMLMPALVYNHPDALHRPWRWAAVHGLFILAESAALFTYWRMNEQAQSDARDSEARMRRIIETALDAVVIMDDDGRIVQWNARAETTFGWSKAEAVGRPISDVVRWPQAASAGFRQWLDVRIEAMAVHRDGHTFPIDVAMAASEIRGVRLFTAFIQDITARKQGEGEMKEAKEAAETANRAKSQFLANMSHEIRTPMNGVLGMVDLLLSTSLTPRQRRFTETVRQSGQSLLRIVNDILDLSKLEAGKLTLELANFDVRETVEEVIDLVAERAQSKGLTLACEIHEDVPSALRGDSGRLRQILVNLVGNAIKFTDRGEVIVRVGLDPMQERSSTRCRPPAAFVCRSRIPGSELRRRRKLESSNLLRRPTVRRRANMEGPAWGLRSSNS